MWVKEAELASLFVSCAQHMHQMGASHMRPTPPLPWHTHAAAFVHISQMLGGVHQRGGRRGARRAAHREQAGPEPFGRSLLKLSSLCTCAGRQERAGSSLRGHAIVGANGISGQVFLAVPYFGEFQYHRRRTPLTRRRMAAVHTATMAYVRISNAPSLVLEVKLELHRLQALERLLERGGPHLQVVAERLCAGCQLGVVAHLLPARRGAAGDREGSSRDPAVEFGDCPGHTSGRYEQATASGGPGLCGARVCS